MHVVICNYLNWTIKFEHLLDIINNPMKNTFFLSLIFLTLSSCSYTKYLVSEKITELNTQNYTKLNGTFRNLATDSANLWFDYVNIIGQEQISDTNCLVEIQLLSRELIAMTLINPSGRIDSVKLRGNIRNGYFEIKKRSYAQGKLLPLFWGLTTHHVRIGLNFKNEIVAERYSSGMAMFFIAPMFAASHTENDVFKRSN